MTIARAHIELIPAARLGVMMLAHSCMSAQDWVQDFKLWLTESPASSYFQELYPNTQVHQGFLEQFRAVTDQAQVWPVP